MEPLIALLRGINVGGKNKLPMKEVVRFFTASGCSNVQTYLQSGNVLFEPGDAPVSDLSEMLSKRIAQETGLQVPVILRSRSDLEAICQRQPYLSEEADPTRLLVYFLSEKPAAAALKTLDPHRSPGDRFIVLGKEIYLHLPNGAADTKLTNAYFDSRLLTVSTGRNWRTVLNLLELSYDYR